MRIGIIGTENSHVEHFVRHLNVENRHEGCRVVALAGGHHDRNRALAATGAVEHIVDGADDLIDLVDAAIVADRHGGLHRKNAVPLLEAGRHVFVDKPTAVTVADTEAIIAAAERGGAILASWSPLRHAPDVGRLVVAARDLGEPQVVNAYGPADPAGPYAGLFFYGPHIVEPALEVLGNPDVSDVRAQRSTHAVTVTALAGKVRLVLSFIRPDERGRTPWHITVAGRHGLVATDVKLGADYNADGLARFLSAAATGTPPMPYEQLIPPVRILESATAQL